MENITRYIEVDETSDYVLPAITLGPARYHERAVHIGIDRGNGKVACLCGLHHKQSPDVWQSPSVAISPDITCGGCLRSMRAMLKKSSAKPYMAVIKKIGQKIEDVQFHVKQTNRTNSNGYIVYEVDPEARVQSVHRKLADGSLLGGCFKHDKADTSMIVGIKALMGTELIHITDTIQSSKLGSPVPVCKERLTPNEEWLKVSKLYNNRILRITCPKCAELYIKRLMVKYPRRDKTFRERSHMVQALSDSLNKVFKDNKQAMAFALNSDAADVPPAWKALVDDYKQAYDNLELLNQSCEEIV